MEYYFENQLYKITWRKKSNSVLNEGRSPVRSSLPPLCVCCCTAVIYFYLRTNGAHFLLSVCLRRRLTVKICKICVSGSCSPTYTHTCMLGIAALYLDEYSRCLINAQSFLCRLQTEKQNTWPDRWISFHRRINKLCVRSMNVQGRSGSPYHWTMSPARL